MSETDLLISRIGHLGSIRLNRPKALNSLTLGLVRGFTRALDEFGLDASVHAVLVTGEGERGLCAGGDIRALYDLPGAERDSFKAFWREEYELNARIASFPKPYVVVMDGVVMGGGVGVSAHGNRRVATERTRLAMPETGIGFIPDVGGSWLLTRDGGAGVYMALSGASVTAADAIHLGLADLMINSSDIPRLRQSLAEIGGAEDVDLVLSDLARAPNEGVLERHKPLLDAAMAHDRVEDIIAALDGCDCEFARRAAREFKQKSPTSLRLTHELLKRASRSESLQSCLVNEFRVACSLLQSHDLFEGIRAAIVDKDRRPRWFPATLAQVQDETIAAMMRGDGKAEPVFRPWTAAAWRGWRDRLEKEGAARMEEGA
ncbi:MAG: 3-hydroxyisobutyryl-CoA hydrolase [Methylocystis sp.]